MAGEDERFSVFQFTDFRTTSESGKQIIAQSGKYEILCHEKSQRFPFKHKCGANLPKKEPSFSRTNQKWFDECSSLS